MKKALLILLTAFLPVAASAASEKDSTAVSGRDIYASAFGLFRPNYLTTGLPLTGPVTKMTADVKFQVSVKLDLWRNIAGREGMALSIGYTQRSIWLLYGESSPFKDNMYIPGLYFNVPFKGGCDFLLAGLEHRSNGRPHGGAPKDGRSRSVNYLFAEYSHVFPFGLTLQTNLRAGLAYYEDDMDQRMFYRYLGYATFTAGYDSPKRRIYAMASVTPRFAPLGTNTTAEFGCRISPPAVGAYVFAQFHYGFDEALCDCLDGTSAVPYLRLGIVLRPSGRPRSFSL